MQFQNEMFFNQKRMQKTTKASWNDKCNRHFKFSLCADVMNKNFQFGAFFIERLMIVSVRFVWKLNISNRLLWCRCQYMHFDTIPLFFFFSFFPFSALRFCVATMKEFYRTFAQVNRLIQVAAPNESVERIFHLVSIRFVLRIEKFCRSKFQSRFSEWNEFSCVNLTLLSHVIIKGFDERKTHVNSCAFSAHMIFGVQLRNWIVSTYSTFYANLLMARKKKPLIWVFVVCFVSSTLTQFTKLSPISTFWKWLICFRLSFSISFCSGFLWRQHTNARHRNRHSN